MRSSFKKELGKKALGKVCKVRRMSGSFLSLLEQRTAVSRHDRLNTRFVVMREHIITPGDSLTVKKKTEREQERERKRETERQRDREKERKRIEKKRKKKEEEKKRKRKKEKEKESCLEKAGIGSGEERVFNTCCCDGRFLRENVVKVVTLTKFKKCRNEGNDLLNFAR